MRLKSYVGKLKQLAAYSCEEVVSDFTKLESAKHLLQISIESCLDISNHIIASENLGAPKNYADSFKILTENDILPKESLITFQRMARFRNRLVHIYWEIEAEAVYQILQENLRDFDTFAQNILEYMDKIGDNMALTWN